MEEKKSKGKPYNPKETEDRHYERWLKAGYFKGDPHSSHDPFTIVIPPPNVTDVLHLGHALNNTIQDILIRRKRMNGFEAEWLPGSDHAGIATQVIVEKQLAKENITRRELGRDKFVERVRTWAYRNKDLILNQLKKIGCSCDWERTRFTLDPDLSRAVTEVFLRLYRKGLIYKGYRIVNWCPKDQTSISDDEVEHKEIDSHLWYIRYKLKGSDDYLTVATTRPETMLGDTALAVNPTDARYKKMVGKMVILPILEREIPVIADNFVDLEFGTGVVKVTPAHDPNDFEIGRRHDLPQINIMNLDGTLNENAGKYKGLDRFEGRAHLLKDLEARGHLVKSENYKLSVGTHDRCHTIVEPMLSEQWFVKMEALAGPAIEAVKSGKLRFHPDHWTKTYLHWLENIRDWCISRQLWWGHRIPIYYCQDCGEVIASATAPAKCPACDSTNILQDEDVLDTWFSSWLWPFSVFGWPEDTDMLKKFYPTDVLSTASEIIFLWVARMVMAGYEFMGELPFSDVYIHGTVRDANGVKMSKSLGNGIDPLLIIDQYGADALRVSMILATPDGQDPWIAANSFELGRNFNNKIWNASRFAIMNLGDEKIDLDYLPKDKLVLIDHWILSRLDKTISAVNRSFDEFRLNAAAKTLYDFVWKDFCDWYIELAKPRFYEGSEEDKKTARHVTGYILKRILLLMHPFIPFITEEIYLQLMTLQADGAPTETIVFGPWPDKVGGFENDELEAKLARIQLVVNTIRNIRSEMNVPPGKRADVYIRVHDNELAKTLNEYIDYYKGLARIENIVISPDVKRPPMSAATVLPGAEIFIPLEGLIDIDFERNRLSKELDNLKNQLEKLSRKLANSDFLANAPAEVVVRDRAKKTEFEDRIEKINANLEQLMNW
ncbi:MAG: valine--tRNA ligase [candidate division Zixibacteria bacterium]|nr:valine--tRNA ligase [candidate division Zixibacteria bacterium]